MIEGEGEARENHQYRGSWYVHTPSGGFLYLNLGGAASCSAMPYIPSL